MKCSHCKHFFSAHGDEFLHVHVYKVQTYQWKLCFLEDWRQGREVLLCWFDSWSVESLQWNPQMPLHKAEVIIFCAKAVEFTPFPMQFYERGDEINPFRGCYMNLLGETVSERPLHPIDQCPCCWNHTVTALLKTAEFYQFYYMLSQSRYLSTARLIFTVGGRSLKKILCT